MYIKAAELGLECQRTFTNLAYIFYYRHRDPENALKIAQNIEKTKIKEALTPYS